MSDRLNGKVAIVTGGSMGNRLCNCKAIRE